MNRMSTWFQSLAVLAFFLVFFLQTPKQVSAGSLIGTHLGEGDLNTQINAVQNVLVPNGLEPGSPVTLMVSIVSASKLNEAEVTNLANAVKTAGYIPIIRVNSVCGADTNFNTISEGIRRIVRDFGENTPIIWGNEMNNPELDGEQCPTMSAYLDSFATAQGVAQSIGVSLMPGAIDFYNGNSIYQDNITTLLTNDLFTSQTRAAANAYGCNGADTETCLGDDLSTIDCGAPVTSSYTTGYERYIERNASPLYLTEFSLFPAPDGNAPDEDLQKVAAFIQSCGPTTPAQYITPLIRDVCGGSGWLLYINGNFFKQDGTKVDPESCEGTQGGFNLSNYPEYGLESDDYYLQSIVGLSDGSPVAGTERDFKMIGRDLVAQGYKAYCAAGEQTINADVSDQGLLEKFKSLYPDSAAQPKLVESTQVLNFESVRPPLFRAGTGKYFLTNSFETFFGFKDVFNSDPSTSELTSAPINSLLSNTQRCIQAGSSLAARMQMCERLESTECILNDETFKELEGENLSTPNAIVAEYNKFAASLDWEPGKDGNLRYSGETVTVCKELMTDPSQSPYLSEALLKMPLMIDKNYRLAFLVASIETIQPSADDLFNFFTGDENGTPDNTTSTHEVMAVAFKIPDIGTEKGTVGLHDTPSNEKGGSINYPDPIFMTRDSLKTAAQIKQTNTESDEARRNLYNTTLPEKFDQKVDDTIFCISGSGKLEDRAGSAACKDHLTKALVDVINSSVDACEPEPAEKVRTLGSSGALDDPTSPNRTFKTTNGGLILNNIFLDDPTRAENPSIQSAQRNFWSALKLNKGNGATTKINMYLVYPVGIELENVSQVLENSFFTKEQLASLEGKKLLEGVGGSTRFRGGGHLESVPETDPNNCTTTITDEGEELLVCGSQTFSVDVKSDGTGGVAFLGGYLGKWVRTAQLALNRSYSSAWNYVASCETTEEFLTGRCAGSLGSASGRVTSCSDYNNITTTIYSKEETLQAVCDSAAKHGINPQMLYGIMQIESSPYLRAQRNGETSMACIVNQCGAVGPMSIVNGACSSSSCGANASALLGQGRENPQNCDMKVALDWAAEYLSKMREVLDVPEEQKDYVGAGYYLGLHEYVGNPQCTGAPTNIQGCGKYNYCQCAVDGWGFTCDPVPTELPPNS